MGVGECGGGDQQAAGAGCDLPVLEQELGFAFVEVVVEVERPQQVAVQGFAARITREQFAVPIWVAALA
ncbi:hypothetical protein D3C71_1140730 [compost metagenome]